ncbi:hypothetical protein [Rugamonas sp. DEMB1]|uniref:hypothetical protein n=1 Tax=Rugamonas sp. DEMB1 TaxID=3039386 RepID=UPI00244A7C8E|nr:hypothetical protein [Rugamonas sp. DEMB1]WGG50672.1 hypothetical protein QC826_30560 [Rugamonas sp. DEMB1]
MTQDITFYFDFASPYAHFAARRIDALAAARQAWTARRGAPSKPLAPPAGLTGR